MCLAQDKEDETICFCYPRPRDTKVPEKVSQPVSPVMLAYYFISTVVDYSQVFVAQISLSLK